MTAKQYQDLINYFKKNKYRKTFIVIIAKIFPIINALMYIFLILYLILNKDKRLFEVIIIPFFVFLFITIMRNLVNKNRPYDDLIFTPFFDNIKKRKGKSFPSRHTSSAVIIAITCTYINVYLGIIAAVIAILIGLSRIIIGVHYPKDVIYGFLFSLVFAMIGFYII